MKKHTPVKKAAAAKNSAKIKQAAPAPATQAATSSSKPKKPLVSKQPRSEKDTALQAGIFLYTDDNWSAAYFNDSDLHCMERELFG
jgi:hypothetical protein